MRGTELEQRLRAARDCDAWIAVVAQFFTAHGLVFGHGTDNAGDEAYWLLRHLTGWRDIDWRAPPPDIARGAAELATERVVSRKPLAYLLKSAWFAGLEFTVDERVLVPRSPMAEVIERGLAPWCALQAGDRVLDIGTGSGCIAIAVAHYCPEVFVDAIDVSPAALEVAAVNVARHGVAARVRLVCGDLFPPGDQPYRAIVANPPYVPAADVARLPPEYRHEPKIALASGATGFDAAERILRGAGARLTQDGVLFLEVGAGAEAFAAAHPRLPLIAIEFEHGGDGVFAITAVEIEEFLRGG